MKLKDCKHGLLIITNGGLLGHIVGLTYNCGVKHTGGMTTDELLSHTIPLVQFPDGTHGIYQGNIDIYKG